MKRTVSISRQDLRREVLRCTTECVSLLIFLHVEFAQPEITKCDVAGVIEKDILWFEIPKKRGLADKDTRYERRGGPVDDI